MADDTLRSNRSNDPYRRAGSGADEQARNSDPLAELARLIGQTDPFAEYAAGSGHKPAAAAPATPDWRSRATPVAAGAPPQMQAAGFQRRDPHQMASGSERPVHPELEELHDAPPFAGPYTAPEPSANARRSAPPNQDQTFLAQGEPMGPDDDEIYDDAPPPRWRAGGVTAVTIIAFAMLGSAGAYAYRSYSTGAKSTQPPPVITAEKAPTKVIPNNDAQSGKNNDRVRDQGPNERVVSREEQPVELRNMITTAAPRVVLQGTQSQNPTGIAGLPGMAPPPQYAPTPQASLPQPGGSTTPVAEPKKVRTVTIRPDNADLSGRPVGSIGDVPRPTTTPPSLRGSGPISLDPRAEPPATRPQPPTAAAPPTRVATAPSSTTPAPSPSGGGYMVQISSQKTDAEAQASIKTLQAKYPHLLNSNPPHVSRADLGAKGVFYRAVVGPFASSNEANSLCSGLKAAGGQCIIQRN